MPGRERRKAAWFRFATIAPSTWRISTVLGRPGASPRGSIGGVISSNLAGVDSHSAT